MASDDMNLKVKFTIDTGSFKEVDDAIRKINERAGKTSGSGGGGTQAQPSGAARGPTRNKQAEIEAYKKSYRETKDALRGIIREQDSAKKIDPVYRKLRNTLNDINNDIRRGRAMGEDVSSDKGKQQAYKEEVEKGRQILATKEQVRETGFLNTLTKKWRQSITGVLIDLHVLRVVGQSSRVVSAMFEILSKSIGYVVDMALIPALPLIIQFGAVIRSVGHWFARLDPHLKKIIGTGVLLVGGFFVMLNAVRSAWNALMWFKVWVKLAADAARDFALKHKTGVPGTGGVTGGLSSYSAHSYYAYIPFLVPIASALIIAIAAAGILRLLQPYLAPIINQKSEKYYNKPIREQHGETFLTKKHSAGEWGWGGFASGGLLKSGQAAVVGEKGPELLIPGSGGYNVVPNHGLRFLAEGTGDGILSTLLDSIGGLGDWLGTEIKNVMDGVGGFVGGIFSKSISGGGVDTGVGTTLGDSQKAIMSKGFATQNAISSSGFKNANTLLAAILAALMRGLGGALPKPEPEPEPEPEPDTSIIEDILKTVDEWWDKFSDGVNDWVNDNLPLNREDIIDIDKPLNGDDIIDTTNKKTIDDIVDISDRIGVDDLVDITNPVGIDDLVELGVPLALGDLIEIEKPLGRDDIVEIPNPLGIDDLIELPKPKSISSDSLYVIVPVTKDINEFFVVRPTDYESDELFKITPTTTSAGDMFTVFPAPKNADELYPTTPVKTDANRFYTIEKILTNALSWFAIEAKEITADFIYKLSPVSKGASEFFTVTPAPKKASDFYPVNPDKRFASQLFEVLQVPIAATALFTVVAVDVFSDTLYTLLPVPKSAGDIYPITPTPENAGEIFPVIPDPKDAGEIFPINPTSVDADQIYKVNPIPAVGEVGSGSPIEKGPAIPAIVEEGAGVGLILYSAKKLWDTIITGSGGRPLWGTGGAGATGGIILDPYTMSMWGGLIVDFAQKLVFGNVGDSQALIGLGEKKEFWRDFIANPSAKKLWDEIIYGYQPKSAVGTDNNSIINVSGAGTTFRNEVSSALPGIGVDWRTSMEKENPTIVDRFKMAFNALFPSMGDSFKSNMTSGMNGTGASLHNEIVSKFPGIASQFETTMKTAVGSITATNATTGQQYQVQTLTVPASQTSSYVNPTSTAPATSNPVPPTPSASNPVVTVGATQGTNLNYTSAEWYAMDANARQQLVNSGQVYTVAGTTYKNGNVYNPTSSSNPTSGSTATGTGTGTSTTPVAISAPPEITAPTSGFNWLAYDGGKKYGMTRNPDGDDASLVEITTEQFKNQILERANTPVYSNKSGTGNNLNAWPKSVIFPYSTSVVKDEATRKLFYLQTERIGGLICKDKVAAYPYGSDWALTLQQKPYMNEGEEYKLWKTIAKSDISNLMGGSASERIPGLALGGSLIKSGLAWVGERGPELIGLPKGAEVMPHTPSMDLLAKKGEPTVVDKSVHYNFDGATFQVSGKDERQLFEEFMKLMERESRRVRG